MQLSGLYPVTEFGISSIELQDSAMAELVTGWLD